MHSPGVAPGLASALRARRRQQGGPRALVQARSHLAAPDVDSAQALPHSLFARHMSCWTSTCCALATQALGGIRLHRQPKALTLLSLWLLGLLAMWLPAPQSIDAPALQKYEEKLNEAAKGDHAHSLAMQVLAACLVPWRCAFSSLAHHKCFTQHGKQSVVAGLQAWWEAQAELQDERTWFWFLVSRNSAPVSANHGRVDSTQLLPLAGLWMGRVLGGCPETLPGVCCKTLLARRQDAERRSAVAGKKKLERAARARVLELERRRERLMSDAKARAGALHACCRCKLMLQACSPFPPVAYLLA